MAYPKDFIVAHGPGFKYVRRVPRKAQALIGKRWWRIYLGSCSRTEARQKARAVAVEHDKLVAAVSNLTPEEQKAVVAEGGFNAFVEMADTMEAFQPILAEIVDAVDRMDEQSEQWPDTKAAHYVKARRELARMTRETRDAVGTRKPIRRKVGAAMGEAPDRGLIALVARWEEVVQPSAPVSVGQKTLYAKRFIACVGDLPVAEITRDHVEHYKDWLAKKDELSHATREKHLHGLHSLLNVAVSEGWVKVNHAHGVKLRAPKGKHADRKNKRKPFAPEQVKLILSKAGSSFGKRSADVEWVVKLTAYHGFRITEACQLRKADVVKLHGVTVLRVHDEVGRVKNSSSVRDVPLHPKCADFVKYAAASPSEWVFVTLPMTKMGRGHWLSGEFGHFLRKVCKIEDRKLTFHSFRHRWNDMAREVEMPIEIRHAILGHALGKGENFSYGAGVPLGKKAKWIKKVDPLK